MVHPEESASVSLGTGGTRWLRRLAGKRGASQHVLVAITMLLTPCQLAHTQAMHEWCFRGHAMALQMPTQRGSGSLQR